MTGMTAEPICLIHYILLKVVPLSLSWPCFSAIFLKCTQSFFFLGFCFHSEPQYSYQGCFTVSATEICMVQGKNPPRVPGGCFKQLCFMLTDLFNMSQQLCCVPRGFKEFLSPGIFAVTSTLSLMPQTKGIHLSYC